VLTAIQSAGLTLKFKKSFWGQSQVKFLGHICGQGKHGPDPEKLTAVTHLVFPKTKRQLKSVLGLTGFYRDYIHDYSTLVFPLTQALKKNAPNAIVVTPEKILAFETLKERLTSAPVLYTPDFDRTFIVQADTSGIAVGSCLCQQFDDGIHPVAYFSAKLNAAQKNYSASELEALGVIMSLKKFDNLIYGRNIIVQTDHSALVHVLEGTSPNPRLERWKIALARYSPSIVYKKAALNANCDALSRLTDVH
jgi:hypothetical protein